jgi:hypothetical protein
MPYSVVILAIQKAIHYQILISVGYETKKTTKATA